jgi:hypothetical protein
MTGFWDRMTGLLSAAICPPGWRTSTRTNADSPALVRHSMVPVPPAGSGPWLDAEGQPVPGLGDGFLPQDHQQAVPGRRPEGAVRVSGVVLSDSHEVQPAGPGRRRQLPWRQLTAVRTRRMNMTVTPVLGPERRRAPALERVGTSRGCRAAALPGPARSREGIRGPGVNSLPVPQIPPRPPAAPRRIHAAEDGDRYRGQPAVLSQRPVKLSTGTLPGLRGIAARSHGEHGHRHAGQLAPVTLEEPVSVTVPAAGIQRRP